MIELNVQQGTREWLNARAKCLTASEAPAMMGVSQYKTRAQLLREKATGYVPEPDAATLGRFSAGHEAEAKARPIVEKIIGAELYPVVATDDSGKYLASSDGVASHDGAITFLPEGFEHKLWNEKLAEEVRAGNVPESHAWQLDHQALVFDFKRIIFVVSDGTEENMVYCWYYPTKERIERLKAGWDQFEIDVANYQPEAAEAKPVGKAPDMLPALFIEVTGAVTASNLAEFKQHAMTVFSGIKTTLATDDDFADAEKTVKWCKEVEDRLEAAKQNALGQTASIDELFRTIDSISAEARRVRLDLDKKVKAEKENRKTELVASFRKQLNEHYDALKVRTGVDCLAQINFNEAIKGLKTLDSMRDKLSAALANAKVEANAIADNIDANRKAVDDMTLFPDFAQVCTKAPEDFAALVALRKMQRQEAEAKRLDAERERIRAEEQAKAQREAQAEANRIAAEEIRKLDADRKLSVASVEPAANECKATIKLGEIGARLGFSVTADFLASIGVTPVATDKNAKLYDEAKFPTICRLIADHVMSLAFKKAA